MYRRSPAILLPATLLALTVLLTPRFSEAQPNYAFERFWPVLPKAWYFDYPNDVAVGPTGIVWIVNFRFYRIEGFSEDGSLLRSIPLDDFAASCLTVDADGALYAGTFVFG